GPVVAPMRSARAERGGRAPWLLGSSDRERRQFNALIASVASADRRAAILIGADDIGILPRTLFDIFPREHGVDARREALQPEVARRVALDLLIALASRSIAPIGNRHD